MANEIELLKLLATGGGGVAVAVVALKGYDVVTSIIKERKGGGETAEHAPRQECLREFSRLATGQEIFTREVQGLNRGRIENGEKMARVEGAVESLRDEVRTSREESRSQNAVIVEQLGHVTRRIDGIMNGRH
jgi:hypothetical protein